MVAPPPAPAPAPAPAVATLRARTAALHDQVDAAFSAFRLDERDGYRDFLIAHARALPSAEAWLAAEQGLPAWRPRTPLLTQDLADLGAPMPAVLPLHGAAGAAAWGMLYVTEGSRLGGALLARQVAPGLPRRYLDAGFGPGEWRAMRAAIDGEAARHDRAWLTAAIAGAEACFALYRRAAPSSPSADGPRSAR